MAIEKTPEPAVLEVPEPVIVETITEPTPLSEVNHYTNTAGDLIQSPTLYSSIPEGATAKCADGTYSFSASRRGTCSHHGGVSIWY